MNRYTTVLPQVIDAWVEDLAVRSGDMDQETRVTIYTFNSLDGVRCPVYDMDVLRRPSIAGRYRPAGMTPLIDATYQAIDELEEIPTRHGEHSKVVFALTDGQNNASRRLPHQLAARIDGLADYWTVAAFVPNQMGIVDAKRCGFPAGNVEVWDPTSARGVAEFGNRIRDVSADFMRGRERGVRGSRNLFVASQVTAQEAAAALDPLPASSYWLADVPFDCVIGPFIEQVTGRDYHPKAGKAFYELTKSVTVQDYKQVMVMDHRGRVYTGPAARQLLGLPDYEVKLQPGHQPGTTIFIQSTSVNRRLIGGTKVIILK